MSPEKYDVIMITKLTTQNRMNRSRQSTSVHPRFSKSVMSRPSRARWSAACSPRRSFPMVCAVESGESPAQGGRRRRKSANLVRSSRSTFTAAPGRGARKSRTRPHAIVRQRRRVVPSKLLRTVALGGAIGRDAGANLDVHTRRARRPRRSSTPSCRRPSTRAPPRAARINIGIYLSAKGLGEAKAEALEQAPRRAEATSGAEAIAAAKAAKEAKWAEEEARARKGGKMGRGAGEGARRRRRPTSGARRRGARGGGGGAGVAGGGGVAARRRGGRQRTRRRRTVTRGGRARRHGGE